MLSRLLATLFSFSMILGACELRDHIAEPSAPCQEDDPCWDCPTMGNRTCGPNAPDWMRDGNPLTGPEEVNR